ncbi:MAG TPA: nitrous oxide reductase accessory protein NosL [Gemmatimonadaceae bacterium]
MPVADSTLITRRRALRQLATVALGAAVVPSLAALEGCGESGPHAIAYGREECAWCRMTVSDARYGAVQLTARGKQQVFDSIECLAQATLALDASEQPRAATRSWVTDSLHPGTLVPASTARYLRSTGPGSPMGKGFRAFASASDAEREQQRNGGVTMSWEEALTVIGSDHAADG